MTAVVAFSAVFLGVVSPQAENANPARLSLPNINWALQIELQGFDTFEQQFLPNLKGRSIKVKDSKNGFIASAYITPAKKPIDVRRFRDQEWNNLRKLGFKYVDVKKYEKDEVAFVEYFIREFEGVTDLNMKNIYSYRFREDMCITLHLSKVKFSSGDQRFFDRFFENTRLIDDYEQTSYDYWLYGSHFYKNGKYEASTKYYQLSLDLEKDHQELTEHYWLVLVDNLAIAYGISGSIDSSIQVLEYGISLKPEYPMFYYNLACGYAEINDIEQMLANLTLSYKYKKNMIAGESLPNPVDDPSFTRFLGNKRFQKLLEGSGE